MPFPQRIRNEVLVASMRSCCICHAFCGTKIELHHIVLESEGGRNTLDNAIPVCFNCHADMTSYDARHPRGSKYSAAELIMHRERWYQRVSSSPLSSYTDESRSLDIQIYQEILGLLPYNGAVQVMRSHVFVSPFRRATLAPLNEYLERNQDPNFEFIDADIEILKAAMDEIILECTEAIDESTFYVENMPDFASVPREWRSSQRRAFYNAVATLQNAGARLGAAHDALLRSCRRKLRA